MTGYVDKAVSDLINRGQTCGYVPANVKIADIQEADVLKHTIDLADLGLPLDTIVLHLKVQRIAGAGAFQVYPNEGGQNIWLASGGEALVGLTNQRLQYAQSVAMDDWDLYCIGYIRQAGIMT